MIVTDSHSTPSSGTFKPRDRFCGPSKEKDLAPSRILYLFIKSFANPCIDISLTSLVRSFIRFL